MSAACASLYSLHLKWPSQICLFAALWYFFILLLTCFWELFWHFLAIKRYSKRVLVVPKNCQERFSSWMLKCKVYDGSGHLMYWVRQQKINISRNWQKSFDILKGIVKMTTEQQLFDRTWKELWKWFRYSAKTTLRLFNILTFKKIFPTLKKLYYIFFINLCYLFIVFFHPCQLFHIFWDLWDLTYYCWFHGLSCQHSEKLQLTSFSSIQFQLYGNSVKLHHRPQLSSTFFLLFTLGGFSWWLSW